jgi:hypothetical protein
MRKEPRLRVGHPGEDFTTNGFDLRLHRDPSCCLFPCNAEQYNLKVSRVEEPNGD